MNTVEQIVGSYGRFSYNPNKEKSGIELNEEFEKLIGSQEGEPASPVRSTVSRIADDVSTAVPAGAGAVLYLYNFLGEATVTELYSGANVNKLV